MYHIRPVKSIKSFGWPVSGLRQSLGPATYLLSILLTFGVSLIVGLMVARKNRSIDMVAALKTEE